VSPVSCPQCSWPSMCGKEKCWKEGSPHTEGECSWFKAIRHKMSTKRLKKMNILVVQLSISVLRCIALKQQEPLKWEKMMKMELKYSDLISRCQHGPQFREAAVELVCKWIEKSNNNIPRDCVVKLCDMFHLLNTFRKEPNTYGHSRISTVFNLFFIRHISVHLTCSSLIICRACIQWSVGSVTLASLILPPCSVQTVKSR